MEKEVLGVYVSGHPLEEYLSLLQKNTSADTSFFQLDEETGEIKVQDGSIVMIGGIITGITRKITKTNTTMAFLTLSMAEVFHAFNMRSLKKSIFTIKNQNKILWLAGAVSFVLSTLLVTITPIAGVFSLTPLTLAQYGIAIAIAFMVIPIVEIVKLITRMVKRTK